MLNLHKISRQETSLPNKIAECSIVILVVTTPDFLFFHFSFLDVI